jgi:hypothetical protein
MQNFCVINHLHDDNPVTVVKEIFLSQCKYACHHYYNRFLKCFKRCNRCLFCQNVNVMYGHKLDYGRRKQVVFVVTIVPLSK